MSAGALSHFDAEGAPRMVDVSPKPETARLARARARVRMLPETAARIRAGTVAKGDVLGVARLAGITAAKRTADLIPLCHPLRLTSVDLELQVGDDAVDHVEALLVGSEQAAHVEVLLERRLQHLVAQAPQLSRHEASHQRLVLHHQHLRGGERIGVVGSGVHEGIHRGCVPVLVPAPVVPGSWSVGVVGAGPPGTPSCATRVRVPGCSGIGNTIVKVLPNPSVDDSSTRPPWLLTTCRTIARPSPVPPVLRKTETGQVSANEQVSGDNNLADGQATVDALDLAMAEQAVAQAEADLADARDARAELDKGPDTVDLTAAQADVDKKQLAVSEAQADLDAATLVASFDGTVLDTSASAGDRITASTPILTLANLNELEVTALIDETTIRDVQTGQPASITFDAYPGQTFRGEVLAVPLQGTLQGGVMVYEVPISLEGADTLPLLVGMTANVAIQTGQAENALLVPTIALQNVGGLTQVLVPNSDPTGDPVSVPVEVGLSNGTYTQVTKGLNIGDQVVIELAASNSSNNFRGFGPGALDGGGPPPGVRPGD